MACISMKMLIKAVLGAAIVAVLAKSAVCLNIVSKSEWGAKPAAWGAKSLSTNPPTYVIIHHSDTPTCTSKEKCVERMKSIQNHHINTKKWSDIGYNFVVGEDGNVYEGRGWGKQGSHSQLYNPKSIGICVIGKYSTAVPNDAALTALKNVIAYGVSNGKINPNYKLLGHRQVKKTDCPGSSLYNTIKTWPNYAISP